MAPLLTMSSKSVIPMCAELCAPLVDGGGCQPALNVGLAIGDCSNMAASCGGQMPPTPSRFVIGRLTGVVCMRWAISSAQSLTQPRARFGEARNRFHAPTPKRLVAPSLLYPHLPDETISII